MIDEDPERDIEYVAEPIGVVLALLPITNPTSTALFKAIVGGQDPQRDDLPALGARGALRRRARSRSSRRPARRPGCRRDALQVIPDPTLDVSQYLFHHPGVDFIWTTGGPKAVAADERGGQAVPRRRPGNAPVYVHRSADVRMAVVDILISKTFDASVICPAEQTCVIDDAIYDELVAELERMGAQRARPTTRSSALAARWPSTPDGGVELRGARPVVR